MGHPAAMTPHVIASALILLYHAEIISSFVFSLCSRFSRFETECLQFIRIFTFQATQRGRISSAFIRNQPILSRRYRKSDHKASWYRPCKTPSASAESTHISPKPSGSSSPPLCQFSRCFRLSCKAAVRQRSVPQSAHRCTTPARRTRQSPPQTALPAALHKRRDLRMPPARSPNGSERPQGIQLRRSAQTVPSAD